MTVPTESLEQPVTRREFVEELGKISSKLDELFKAKQISWPLIISVLALAMGVLGFGIKNLADVASLSSTTESNASAVGDFRERIRALEANTHAIVVENETQNRWMADVTNLQDQYLDTLLRIQHPEIPARSYWPMDKIGGANPTNGNK